MSDDLVKANNTKQQRCKTCGALGFNLSPLGKDRCSFCDGTEGGFWYHNREEADKSTAGRRIAVIRRERVEGQPPQYFTEEV